MKKNSILLFLLCSAMGAAAQNWPEVRPEARPGSRWWWLGSAVDKDNLNYNLKEYGKAGLGSLEVTPIYGVREMNLIISAFCHPNGWKCSVIRRRWVR